MTGPILSTLTIRNADSVEAKALAGVTDSWAASSLLKASMGVQIALAVLSLLQLLLILKDLRKLPNMSTRAPYILLGFVTLSTAIAYTIWAVITRNSDDLAFETTRGLSAATTFFFGVDIAFRPAVVLWIVHKRSNLFVSMKGVATWTLSSRPWKKLLDWVLVGSTFILLVTILALNNTLNTAVVNNNISDSEYDRRNTTRLAVGHTITGLFCFLALDVVVSVAILYTRSVRAHAKDWVIARLLLVVAPFYAVYAIEVLIFDIYTSVLEYGQFNYISVNLAQVVIDGVCRIAIATGIILTMSLPGIQWSPSHGATVTYQDRNDGSHPTLDETP